MATVVYQGFQSYFESQLFEPKTLRLKLSTPLKSQETNNTSSKPAAAAATTAAKSPDSSSGGWSFLQSLSNEKESKKLDDTYVQRPSSRRTLSDESLALCTESLGSETGSDVIQEDEFLSLSSDLQDMEIVSESRTCKSKKRNVISKTTTLPPPLTSMRGFDCIQVKPHRENGRLVMTATRTPPRNRCFQTDRSDGCVRISMLVNKNEQETILEDQEEEEEEEEEKEVKVMEKVERRRRRCFNSVEDERINRGFLNWESCCVATS